MPLEIKLNEERLLGSLPQLRHILLEATQEFEAFLMRSEDSADIDLKRCIEQLEALDKGLNALPAPGAALTCEELLSVIMMLDEHPQTGTPKAMATVGVGLLSLNDYLALVDDEGRDLPLLCLDTVNALRQCSGLSVLMESQVCQYEPRQYFSRSGRIRLKNQALSEEAFRSELSKHIRSYRQALLALMNGDIASSHFEAMQRIARWICQSLPAGPAQRFWLLCESVFSCFRQRGLNLNISRQRLFLELEQVLRRGLNSASQDLFSADLERELIFLLSLSDYRGGSVGRLCENADIEAQSLTDSALQSLNAQLSGPSVQTLQGVVSSFREDLQSLSRQLHDISRRRELAMGELGPAMDAIASLARAFRQLHLHSLENALSDCSDRLSSLDIDASPEEVTEQCEAVADLFYQIDRRLSRLSSADDSAGTLLASNPYLDSGKRAVFDIVRSELWQCQEWLRESHSREACELLIQRVSGVLSLIGQNSVQDCLDVALEQLDADPTRVADALRQLVEYFEALQEARSTAAMAIEDARHTLELSPTA